MSIQLHDSLAGVKDKDIGGCEGYSLPEPVATWHRSFYTDYMTYLDIAGRDSVLAAQVASPGTQVTIQIHCNGYWKRLKPRQESSTRLLMSVLENRTIADLVEQFTQDEKCEWLMNHDFFMGNNGTFATVREVSETSHDIMMGDTISSDVSAPWMSTVPVRMWVQPRLPLWMRPLRLPSQEGHWRLLVYPVHPHRHQGHCLEQRHHQALLAIEDIKPDEYYQASDQIRGALQNLRSRSNSKKSPKSPAGSTLLRSTQTTCGQTTSRSGRLATDSGRTNQG